MSDRFDVVDDGGDAEVRAMIAGYYYDQCQQNLDKALAERDRARDIAVRLEQEVDHLRRLLDD